MTAKTPLLSVAAVVLALLAGTASAKFTLNETWQGTTFFDHFNFFTSADPTSGTVTYVSQTTATSGGLISTNSAKAWMRVESSKTLGSSENRQSIRIESKRQFNSGLFVIGLTHMPTGCATWPAFWMYGPNWPAGGEIDIIEGVSNETKVHTTLHTTTGCDMSAQRTDMMTGSWGSSGSTTYTNCYVYAYGTSNMGCVTRGKENSIGAGFNKNGGGVYATVWNSTMIAVWFWPTASVPSDLSSSNPNPLNWGLPQSRFPLGTWCDSSHFANNWIVFDTTLCGEWAGNNFGSDCPALGSSWADCNTYVRNNPSAFKEAYWEVDYVKIYSWDGNADATPTVTTGTQPNPPTWPSTVTVLDPSTPTVSQKALDAAFATNGGYSPAWNGEFSSSRFTFLLLPGTHAVTANVGYYTSIIGAGAKPTDTVISTLTCNNGDYVYTGGALANFWRSAENMYTANKVVWAVSQAAPMRRMSIANDLDIYQYNSGCCAGYASGGYLADSTITGTVSSGSQQQWFTRNTYAKTWSGGVWNMVFVGNTGGFPSSHCSNVDGNPYSTITSTPVIAEKPYVKYSSGKYYLVIPNVERDKSGPTTNFSNAVTVGFENVYVASAADSAAKINTMLAGGTHVVMAPGIYSLTEPIAITKANTVLLGLGFATLVSTTGKPCITVADVDGVRVSSVLLQAGPVNTDALIQFGVTSGYRGTTYSFMHDVFARVGGTNNQAIQQVSATTMMHVIAGNVVIDNTWLWRADHGVGGLVYNSNNPCTHGAVIDGDDVTAYALAAEHTLGDMVQWNGNNGRTYFYQSEYPYDVTQANYGDKGYVAYHVANDVTKHTAWGVGAYTYFRDSSVTIASAIKAPARPAVIFTNSLSVFLNGNGGIKHIVNSQGDAVLSGTTVKYLCAFGPGTDTNCYLDSLPTGASAWNTCASSNSPGSTCSLKCSSGYTAVAGKCEITGSWSTKPSCTKSSGSSKCTLSGLPSGASAWNTCSSSVDSGSSCTFTCSSGYTAVSGTCSSGSWSTTPTCVKTSCALSALPTGATAWNTCSASMASGSSCAFTCSSGYTAVTGSCSSGTWTTAPTCQVCTPSKTCGTQTCGAFWDGCKTTTCGSCGSTSYCNGQKCVAIDLLSEWNQVSPDNYTSKNWNIAYSTLSQTNMTLPTTQRIVSYIGAQTGWMTEGYNTISVGVQATDGTVGIGLKLWQADNRVLDRLEWKIVISGEKANTYFCVIFYGSATCSATATNLAWKTSGFNNFTVNMQVGSTYINNYGWLNSNAMVTSAMTALSSKYKRTGQLFMTTTGSATKTFKNMTIRSKTAVHVLLTNCMTTSQWNTFVANLLGVSTSSVSSRGTLGVDSYCTSRRRSTGEYPVASTEVSYNEFDMLLEDDELTGTPSASMADVFNTAVADGAATWSGITVSSLTSSLPLTSAGTMVGASSASLSALAIGGIAAGGAVVLVGAAAIITGVAVKRSRKNQDNERAADALDMSPRHVSPAVSKMVPSSAGVDVMNNPEKTHSSITGRAVPVAQ